MVHSSFLQWEVKRHTFDVSILTFNIHSPMEANIANIREVFFLQRSLCYSAYPTDSESIALFILSFGVSTYVIFDSLQTTGL